ncbi:MAG: hypothetical protein PHV33_03540 [Elusimicrobiales bacterium]|nr:hypothetical protein [Elusimicrobiales bacterium]
MSPTALTMMLTAWITVTAFTLYFFWKVVKTPPRAEPDSYAANDDEPR